MTKHATQVPAQTVELLPLRSASAGSVQLPPLLKLRDTLLKNIVFVIMVAVPTFLAFVYLVFIAADRYESQATFIVRSPSNTTVSQLAMVIQGSGAISSTEDAHIVREYVLSRNAMSDLETQLKAIFRRPEVDFLWRFPKWFSNGGNEAMYRHYLNFVSVTFDKTTAISTLKVQGFRPEDARNLSVALLDNSERLLNRLNERAQADAIQTAKLHVEQAQQRANAAQEQITAFRNRESVIDPSRMSNSVLETIARLSLETAQTNVSLPPKTEPVSLCQLEGSAWLGSDIRTRIV